MRHHSIPARPLMAAPPPAQAHAHAAAPVVVTRGLVFDVYRGVVWGDFDQDLRVGGAVAQAVVGFVPVVGTITAVRDLLACLRQRDLLGIVLNLLALFPVLGGLAKTADALHTIHRYHRATRRRHEAAGAQRAHRRGCVSLALTLLVAGCAALYGIGVHTLFAMLWAHGPTLGGYTLRGDGAWVAPLVLLPLGLAVGLMLTLRRRLWLGGLVLLPIGLVLGFSTAITMGG